MGFHHLGETHSNSVSWELYLSVQLGLKQAVVDRLDLRPTCQLDVPKLPFGGSNSGSWQGMSCHNCLLTSSWLGKKGTKLRRCIASRGILPATAGIGGHRS